MRQFQTVINVVLWMFHDTFTLVNKLMLTERKHTEKLNSAQVAFDYNMVGELRTENALLDTC